MIGVGISFVGACILMLASKNESGSIEIIPILLLLLATVFYAINVTTVKAKLGSIPAKMLSAYVFHWSYFYPRLLRWSLQAFLITSSQMSASGKDWASYLCYQYLEPDWL